MKIVVAFSAKNFGIGKNGALPWRIKDDLKRFAEITKGGIVVMGYNTWMSIPEDKRPLKDRLNVVVTSKIIPSNDNVVFLGIRELDAFLLNSKREIYIIGGSKLYEMYVGIADEVIATVIDKNVDCDVFFNTKQFGKYRIQSYSDLMHDPIENCNYRYINYKKTENIHDEYRYLSLLSIIQTHGEERPDRTGIGTRSVFAPYPLKFDISKGTIPLVTTKFVGIKMIIKELLWFLKGKTDSKILENQGVNIWKDNTTRQFLDKRGLTDYKEGDIGSMYGWIWRHVGAEYKGCDADYTGQGYDQISDLIKGLKEDPYSRRHMITTYCPIYNDKGVLLPCHGIIAQFYVHKNGGGLSCHVYCRSQDTFLGQVINFASYAILTHVIGKMTGLEPQELTLSMGDAHIYANHLEQVKLQLTRQPLPFPILEINEAVKNKSVDELDLADFNLVGYLHHEAIKAPMAV